MSKITYLVTGATGFVGNNLIRQLELEKDATIIALARSKTKVQEALPNTKAKIIYGDVRNLDDIEALFAAAPKDQKIIFVHTASVVHIGNNKKIIKTMRDVNINGVKAVVAACKKHKCRLLYVSSVHAITEPKNRALTTEIKDFDPKKVHGVYAKTKAEATRLVMEAINNDGLDAVIVHPAGITGPGDFSDTHLTQMVEDFANNRIPAGVKGGYDFVDVRDVAIGIVQAIKFGKTGECYLLSNQYYTVSELLDMMHQAGIGKKLNKKLPMWLARLGLPFLAMYFKVAGKRPLYTSYSLYTLNSNSNYSHKKATEAFGYTPRGLKESITDTVAFLKKRNIIK